MLLISLLTDPGEDSLTKLFWDPFHLLYGS